MKGKDKIGWREKIMGKSEFQHQQLLWQVRRQRYQQLLTATGTCDSWVQTGRVNTTKTESSHHHVSPAHSLHHHLCSSQPLSTSMSPEVPVAATTTYCAGFLVPLARQTYLAAWAHAQICQQGKQTLQTVIYFFLPPIFIRGYTLKVKGWLCSIS